jgi:hypothetical protein
VIPRGLVGGRITDMVAGDGGSYGSQTMGSIHPLYSSNPTLPGSRLYKLGVSGHATSLKCFANPQAEGVTVPAASGVGTKIEMILLVQLEPQPAAAIGKEVAAL